MTDDIGLVLSHVVGQHLEETAHLLVQRWQMLCTGGVTLRAIVRLDERMAAHVDGLRVAGRAGWDLAMTAAKDPVFSSADTFAAAVLALESADSASFLALLSGARHRADERGCLAALGWVSGVHLRGIVAPMLCSTDPRARRAALLACIAHQVSPPNALVDLCEDSNSEVRAVALRAVGTLKARSMLANCHVHLLDVDPSCAGWAAWAAVVLGDRDRALRALARLGMNALPATEPARRLALMVSEPTDCRTMLRALAEQTRDLRRVLAASGLAGLVDYVPWLIRHMEAPETARVAGGAFSLITGADLAAQGLDRPAPEDYEYRPAGLLENDAVPADPDAGKAWPDVDRIDSWWAANKHRFVGTKRLFWGEPPNIACCERALVDGCQEARSVAALYLSLLVADRPLFQTSAPGWRQLRMLQGRATDVG
ncbi:hypothetical protein AWB67_01236 [Caballeronia terrestris]|uniref:TIGR02270 family protein n=1 Tax=Caballeronia terrestris TaxID=1226301 RepID=A0A158GAU4_9BURK|nr:TIGR02270 family protein [Caballeronia terrestris]SAL29142.1 hypothetical protein AWB67_01236 [Caballeronia terrestris]